MDYRNFVQIFVGRNRTKKPPKTSKTSLLPMGWDVVSVAYLFLLGNPLFLQCHSRRMASAFGIGNEHHINAFRQAFHIDFIAVFHGLHILS